MVIWDLNRTSKTKHDLHYGEHKRTVHRVEIHPTDGNLILTGSQDNSMKIFDRRERFVTHFSSSDAVRDVQFNPNQPYKFAAALESGKGMVPLRLLRTDKWYVQFVFDPSCFCSQILC